jgi:hypothetical protein
VGKESTPNSDYRPRLAAELTPEQHSKLLQILPHGMQKPLFQALVSGVLELYDKGGLPAIGAIVTGHISITQIVSMGFSRSRKSQIVFLEAKLEELRNGNN